VPNGILAVVGTDRSWREVPKEYGKRDRAYTRYRLWRDQGLWARIIAALADPGYEVSDVLCRISKPVCKQRETLPLLDKIHPFNLLPEVRNCKL